VIEFAILLKVRHQIIYSCSYISCIDLDWEFSYRAMLALALVK
jgi:hypothetical protein